MVQWEWDADGQGRWLPFPPECSVVIEAAALRGAPFLTLRSGQFEYLVDLVAMCQMNVTTFRRRSIRRVGDGQGQRTFETHVANDRLKRPRSQSVEKMTKWEHMKSDEVPESEMCQICLIEFHGEPEPDVQSKATQGEEEEEEEVEAPGKKRQLDSKSNSVVETHTELFDCVRLSKCHGHFFHKECIKTWFQQKPKCPSCGIFYGEEVGTQPIAGRMLSSKSLVSLPGYSDCGTIEIHYFFPNGIQQACHPNPGQPYSGTIRRAFLPDNEEGNRVLELLRRAFANRVTFTVGTSLTSGLTNAVIWNGIHHKTNRHGGPQAFGYPDPTYLNRVTQELAAKGIV